MSELGDNPDLHLLTCELVFIRGYLYTCDLIGQRFTPPDAPSPPCQRPSVPPVEKRMLRPAKTKMADAKSDAFGNHQRGVNAERRRVLRLQRAVSDPRTPVPLRFNRFLPENMGLAPSSQSSSGGRVSSDADQGDYMGGGTGDGTTASRIPALLRHRLRVLRHRGDHFYDASGLQVLMSRKQPVEQLSRPPLRMSTAGATAFHRRSTDYNGYTTACTDFYRKFIMGIRYRRKRMPRLANLALGLFGREHPTPGSIRRTRQERQRLELSVLKRRRDKVIALLAKTSGDEAEVRGAGRPGVEIEDGELETTEDEEEESDGVVQEKRLSQLLLQHREGRLQQRRLRWLDVQFVDSMKQRCRRLADAACRRKFGTRWTVQQRRIANRVNTREFSMPISVVSPAPKSKTGKLVPRELRLAEEVERDSRPIADPGRLDVESLRLTREQYRIDDVAAPVSGPGNTTATGAAESFDPATVQPLPHRFLAYSLRRILFDANWSVIYNTVSLVLHPINFGRFIDVFSLSFTLSLFQFKSIQI